MRVKFAPMTANPLHDPSHASPLGKATEYQSHYAPELLYPIPRQLKRSEIGIVDAALPFVGEDLWNAYELSWLNPKGKPVVAVGCFRVPVDSPNLIESKSFKLYLNSFNHTRFESLEAVSATMTRDLSATAGRPVGVNLQELSSKPVASIGSPDGILIDDPYEAQNRRVHDFNKAVDDRIIGPVAHRMLHRFHLDEQDLQDSNQSPP